MKHAMFLPYDAPDKMIEWAQKLEQAGFDSAWQGELTNSALIPLAAVAPAVKNIQLGAGVVLAFTHSPVMLAFEEMVDAFCAAVPGRCPSSQRKSVPKTVPTATMGTRRRILPISSYLGIRISPITRAALAQKNPVGLACWRY